jgi:hypothetical protein
MSYDVLVHPTLRFQEMELLAIVDRIWQRVPAV